MRICPDCHLTYHEDETRCLVDGATLEVAEDERIGSVLAGRYVLEDVLGEGGMATVYRARHNLVERPCAVKILHPELSRDATLRERLRREARSAAAISHPHVVEIFDFGETPAGEPFLVMELLNGASLRDMIGEPLPLDQVIELGKQIASGLARAHDLGVVHRDLKPENVFVVETENGPTVKLVDFGLAQARRDDRLTATGEIVGTPQYMAPERFKDGEVLPAADLYALGILLFELATGELPFESNNIAGYVLAHLEEAPRHATSVVPSLPLKLDELIDELLRKKPDERPVDAHQVLERLQAIRPGKKTRMRITTTRGEALPRVLVTLDRWQGRVEIYGEMLRRVYPSGAPDELNEYLAEMRAALGRLTLMRNRAMEAQRELERLEAETMVTRERLGHAVHVLGVDLSSARADVRTLEQNAEEHETAVREHRGDWHAADGQLACLRQNERETITADEQPSAPGDAEVGAARRALAAIEAWHRAREALTQAQRRLAASRDHARDLSYQTEALRERLKRVEADFDHEAKESRARLSENGIERRKVEMRILYLASKLSAPLREHSDLNDLFTRIEEAS